MKIPWMTLGIGLLTACPTSAKAPDITATASGDTVMPRFLADFLPSDYQQVARRRVTIDGESADWVRYQPPAQSGIRLGEAHFSVIWSAQGKLQGFADMRLPEDAALPDKAAAQAAADAFLRQYAPDLLRDREIHWIDRHDETLHHDGQRGTLSGMKVKMRNRSDGRWFWVIVGGHGRPIVFERDIVWISFPGKRQTEKWLHDDWLAARGQP